MTTTQVLIFGVAGLVVYFGIQFHLASFRKNIKPVDVIGVHFYERDGSINRRVIEVKRSGPENIISHVKIMDPEMKHPLWIPVERCYPQDTKEGVDQA